MKNLGIDHVYQGHEDKLGAFAELLEKTGLTPEQVAHVGDDVLDLLIMVRVGFAVAVADANPAVKPFSDWCTTRAGGQGAVREVCDLLLKAQGHFDNMLRHYLS